MNFSSSSSALLPAFTRLNKKANKQKTSPDMINKNISIFCPHFQVRKIRTDFSTRIQGLIQQELCPIIN
jgi:hypothetical protein